jgi:hypothetical protein
MILTTMAYFVKDDNRCALGLLSKRLQTLRGIAAPTIIGRIQLEKALVIAYRQCLRKADHNFGQVARRLTRTSPVAQIAHRDWFILVHRKEIQVACYDGVRENCLGFGQHILRAIAPADVMQHELAYPRVARQAGRCRRRAAVPCDSHRRQKPAVPRVAARPTPPSGQPRVHRPA